MANLKIAKAQLEQALLSFHQSLLNAGAEVNNAVTRWQTARNRISTDEQQITHWQTVVDDTRLMMRHGSATNLEILIARQSLLAARLEMVSARLSEIQSVIELYHALGGGCLGE